MKTTIYKYQLQKSGEIQDHLIFEDAAILSAYIQGDKICLWAMVDLDRSFELRQFIIFGTGHPIPPDILPKLRFIGTVHQHEYLFVWHIFEVRK